jgi:pyruvate dehydrogenase E2 component (dihydrolipoamide acetyltransferase)
LDLAQVPGTGPEGCILGRDVLRFNEEQNQALVQPQRPTPAPAIETFLPGRVVPFTGMRRVIAQRMTESLRTTAQATLNAEADVTDLLRLRQQVRTRPAPTHTDLVIKAAALALKEHPRLNAILLGDEIELLEDIHIGFSVPLPDGLLVPVIRNADRRLAGEIAQEGRRLARAARAGRLTVDDVTGSTFTVTDLGIYGVDFFVPIINPPEVAILGIGRLAKKLVLHQGRRLSRARLMLCLAFDHRVVDGAPAAAFLRTLIRLLARPQALFD